MPEKILTIIVPSYNMEAYLPKCLGSLEVSPELMERLEVLVVNDGSKDRTSEIAHSFAAKWPGTFKVIDKENGHYGSCINAALPVATGFYVKVLDADDWFDTNGFVDFLWFLHRTKEIDGNKVDLVLTDYDCVDERGNDTGKIRQKLPVDKVFDVSELVRRPFFTFMHGYAYRTEHVREIGYRQSEGMIYTDTEWIFYPAATAKGVRYFPRVVYIYLYGREGQTVCSSVARKSTMAYVALLFAMIDLYQRVDKDVSDVGVAYMKKHLMRISRRTYTGYLLYSPWKEALKGARQFDKKFKRKSLPLYIETATGAGKFLLGIRVWRHSGVFGFVVIALLRMIMRLKGL